MKGPRAKRKDISPTLLNTLRKRLRAFSTSNVAAHLAEDGKAYELALIAHTVETFRNDGYTPQYKTWLGTNSRSLVYRGAPGLITNVPPPHSSRRPSYAKPGYISLTKEDEEFELHNGVQWMGTSGVRHEADISLIPQWMGHVKRHTGEEVSGGIIFSVECKYRTLNPLKSTPSLPLSVGRELITMNKDVDPFQGFLVTNVSANANINLLFKWASNGAFMKLEQISGITDNKLAGQMAAKLLGTVDAWFATGKRWFFR